MKATSRSPGTKTDPDRLGAWPAGDGWYSFRVWAPRVQRIELEIESLRIQATREMERGPDGYHTATVGGLADGALYRYRGGGGAGGALTADLTASFPRSSLPKRGRRLRSG